MPCDVLILAAFEPELARLQERLGGKMGRVGRTHIVLGVAGVGLSAAAAGAAVLVHEAQPRTVVAVGTCGAYTVSSASSLSSASRLAIGHVVVASKVRLVDRSVLQRSAEFPPPMTLVANPHPGLIESIVRATGATPADVATTLGITVGDAEAAAIAEATGAHVEHLEAHAMATACALPGVPFAAVLGVANVVGSRARDEWRENHAAAAAAAADAVLRWLESVDSIDRVAGR